ncbi:MAG: DUF1667 domain-containing protein [Rectinema sp.]
MSELTCITCPIGCRLEVETSPDGGIKVSGNRCARGAVYAREEFLTPKRMVTATCRIKGTGGAGGMDKPSEPAESAAGSATGSVAGSATALPAGPPAGPARGQQYRPRRVPVRTTAAFPREKIVGLLEIIYAIQVELPVVRGKVLAADLMGTGIDLIAARDM